MVPWTPYDYDTVPAAYNPYQTQLSKSTAYLLSLGVDGFLTNRPAIARGILLAEGVGAPPSVG